MNKNRDPDGIRLPIKIDSTTNGEFSPLPLSRTNQLANKFALQMATENAKRLGIKRRDFLTSLCGAASTLLAVNTAHADAGSKGGYFQLDKTAALDKDIAKASLHGSEFIFDVQGHYVNPHGNWLNIDAGIARALPSFSTKAHCSLAEQEGKYSLLECLGPDEFIKDVFLDSDTNMMVLSFVPSLREAEPITIEEASATREIVEKMEGAQRLMIHGRVNPNQDGDLQGMDELAESWDISAWKTYTQWGRDGIGFFLSDDIGLEFIEKAIKLNIRNICVHKGIPFGPISYEHSLCDDIGIVAQKYPQVNFLVYHSGYVPGQQEGPYDESRNEGVDSLIKTLIDNEIKPNSNVYAELGSTWRSLMQDPNSAAHTMGKLFKHVGEDNILWGTDSIWYGSPQDQIQAFRSFQISSEFQEKFEYTEITPTMRSKIFGLNAIKPYNISMEEVRLRTGGDKLAVLKEAYTNSPDPCFLTYGPKTRREFLNFLSLSQTPVT